MDPQPVCPACGAADKDQLMRDIYCEMNEIGSLGDGDRAGADD